MTILAILHILPVFFSVKNIFRQNTIEFYRNVISKLNRALADPTFELYYGKEVKQHLLDMLKGTQSQAGIESIIADCEQLYENAISKQIYAFVDDYVDAVVIIKDYVFNTKKANLYEFDKYITTDNDMYALETVYNYNSAEETIDSGKMCSVALDYTGLNVESVVVNNG